jgi:hypothetical protein
LPPAKRAWKSQDSILHRESRRVAPIKMDRPPFDKLGQAFSQIGEKWGNPSLILLRWTESRCMLYGPHGNPFVRDG